MIVTLTGPNDFLRQAALEKIITDFTDQLGELADLAIERFEGEQAKTEAMAASLKNPPFLTRNKLVILREPSKQKAFAEDIETLLTNVPQEIQVVIIEPKLDKRLGFYKFLKNYTDLQDFPELDAAGLIDWATGYAKAKGGSLGRPEAKNLVERVGLQQQSLKMEIDKLLAYSKQITAESIEQLIAPTPQSTVFELIDAAFSGQANKAIRIYDDQRSQKTEPQAILAMLAWQLHILAVVKAGGTRPAPEIASTAKLNPFVVRKAQTAAQKLSWRQLQQKISELLQLDWRLKNTTIDADDALRLYILTLHI